MEFCNFCEAPICHRDNFPLETLKLGWVAFHSLKFQLKCLDFRSNQYKKLAPVLSGFCNGQYTSTSTLPENRKDENRKMWEF